MPGPGRAAAVLARVRYRDRPGSGGPGLAAGSVG